MQRVIILLSLQYFQKSSELWLLWPLIKSRRWVPTTFFFVCSLKCFSHARLSLLVVQPFLETLITQLWGISPSLYQLERWWRALSMMKGGIVHPVALIPWMTVAHSLLPGWIVFSRPRLSKAVITAPRVIQPIIKPVSSKWYVSLSQILYLAFILATRLNQS